jgi:hypothetical protein
MVDGIYRTWTSGKSLTESIIIRAASGTRAGLAPLRREAARLHRAADWMVSSPYMVPRDGFDSEESWSEWQDLNLRPPRPERSTRPPYSVRQQRLSPLLEPPRQASHELPYTDFWEATMPFKLDKLLRLLLVCPRLSKNTACSLQNHHGIFSMHNAAER